MILLKNVFLNNKVCDILLNQNKIVKIADTINTSADEIIDCKDKAISVLAGKVEDIFRVATQNGFSAFGINAGEIKEGKLADFILVDMNNQFLLPNNNLISNMIYAADSSCITDVFCDGNPVMRNRQVPHETDIISDFKRVCAEFLE